MKDIARELVKVARLIVADFEDDLGERIGKSGKQIKGWKPDWDYPGYVVFRHPKYERQVAATPWFDNNREISVQVQESDGDFVGGIDVKLQKPLDIDTDSDSTQYDEALQDGIDDYFRAMNRAWSKVMKIVDTYDHRKLMKEIYPKFEKWIKEEQRTGGELWHYEEDFYEDIEGFVEITLPDVVPDRVKEKVVKELFDEEKDSYVERGSRYDEQYGE
jgi:hypothetical protein